MQSPSQWGSKLRIYVTLSVVSGRSKSLSSVVGKDLARRCLRHRYYIIFLGEFYCNSSGSDSPRSVLLKFDVTASPGELSHGRGLNVHVHLNPKCSNRLKEGVFGELVPTNYGQGETLSSEVTTLLSLHTKFIRLRGHPFLIYLLHIAASPVCCTDQSGAELSISILIFLASRRQSCSPLCKTRACHRDSVFGSQVPTGAGCIQTWVLTMCGSECISSIVTI